MRAVFALVLVVGMALAGVAVYMAQGYVSQREAELAKANAFREKVGKLVKVYAVNKSMKFGDPLTKDDVSEIYVQESVLPAGAFKVLKEGEVFEAPTPTEAKDGEEVIQVATAPLFPPNVDKPRFIMRSMEPNEVILASRVTEPGQMAGLAGKLEKGMSAFQLRVDLASGVAGFVAPDDFVDIYWTGNSEQASGEVTRLIETAVRIIAVDQATGEGQGTGSVARTVTVAATREQIARLTQAQNTGRLAMSLVSDPADQVAGGIEVDGNSLLGIEAQEVVVVEAKRECTIKTRKGADLIEMPIPCTN